MMAPSRWPESASGRKFPFRTWSSYSESFAGAPSSRACAGEETLDSTQCGGRENCLENQRCMTHDLWEELNTTVYGFLSGVSLAQLVEKQRTRPVSVVRSPRSHNIHPVSA